jgi:hypothetical protein
MKRGSRCTLLLAQRRAARMVRLYFEMRKGDRLIQDLEGQEFKNLTEAKMEAEAVLREQIADDIASEAPLQPRSIAIHNKDQNILAVVGLSATLEKEVRCLG